MAIYNVKQTKPVRPRRKKLFIALTAVAALILIILALELTNTTHLFHKAKKVEPVTATHNSAATAGETKGEPQANTNNKNNAAPQNNNASNTQPGDSKSTTSPTVSGDLVTPSGTFVSNHRPSLSGSSAPSTVTSACTTSPGATCQIIFTNGSETKSLPAQITDRGGSTYWTWTPQQIGITSPSSWTIQVKATSGSQTKTANDSIALDVQP